MGVQPGDMEVGDLLGNDTDLQKAVKMQHYLLGEKGCQQGKCTGDTVVAVEELLDRVGEEPSLGMEVAAAHMTHMDWDKLLAVGVVYMVAAGAVDKVAVADHMEAGGYDRVLGVDCCCHTVVAVVDVLSVGDTEQEQEDWLYEILVGKGGCYTGYMVPWEGSPVVVCMTHVLEAVTVQLNLLLAV